MRMQQQGVIPDMAGKKEVLRALGTVYSGWVARFPLACRKGCSACCTRSVTMTSLEGEVILDFIKEANRDAWLAAKLAAAPPGKGGQGTTMNQFAEACLCGQEVAGDSHGDWDFTPCIFLEGNTCSIYAVRPFGCRSFGSFVQCTEDGAAEMAPVHLSVNTVFCQIIEHVNSDGGYCSTMTDILRSLDERGSRREKLHLLPARPLPGFLLDSREARVVKALLQQLDSQFSAQCLFGDLIDNFMPI